MATKIDKNNIDISSDILISPDFENEIAVEGFKRTKLRKIHLTKDTIRLGEYAFESCVWLEDVQIDNSDSISIAAFKNCFNLKNVKLPDNLLMIGPQAFWNCSKLESIALPKGLKYITGYAFNNTGLKEIIIPDAVTSIDNNSFENCTNLEKIVFPKNLKKIDYAAFFDCLKLETITLPEGLEEIGTYAFAHSPKTKSALKEVFLPKSVKIIKDNAFSPEVVIHLTKEQLEQNAHLNFECTCIIEQPLDKLIDTLFKMPSKSLSEINKEILNKEANTR